MAWITLGSVGAAMYGIVALAPACSSSQQEPTQTAEAAGTTGDGKSGSSGATASWSGSWLTLPGTVADNTCAVRGGGDGSVAPGGTKLTLTESVSGISANYDDCELKLSASGDTAALSPAPQVCNHPSGLKVTYARFALTRESATRFNVSYEASLQVGAESCGSKVEQPAEPSSP